MSLDRGGNGGTGTFEGGKLVWRFPETDGKGCPVCGAIGLGGHGGGCPNQGKPFNEQGDEIGERP